MKFFIYFLVVLFSCFVLWSGIVFGQIGGLTKSSQWIDDAYEKKESIAKDIDGKKVVIVAGSNALFGIDSKLIENAFGVRVVNFGVNAGIELPLTLFIAKKVIRDGDTVLMPLEYPMYSYDGTPGVQMIDYVLSREASFFWNLSLYEQFYVLWHVDIRRVYDGYLARGGVRVSRGVYGAHHIDGYGDQIKTELKYKEPYMRSQIKKHILSPETYGASFDRNALGWKYLDDFVTWCEGKNVKVIFMPSTLMKSKSYFDDPKERWFYENIAKEVRKKGWNYVGKPYEYMFDSSQYFNTNFHLINKARKVRTLKMIDDLRKAYGGSI